jgi:hypothetical protein
LFLLGPCCCDTEKLVLFREADKMKDLLKDLVDLGADEIVSDEFAISNDFKDLLRYLCSFLAPFDMNV